MKNKTSPQQPIDNHNESTKPYPLCAVTPCIELTHPLFEKYNVQVWVKQDYLNHPDIQGNKLHKLKYNLTAAVEQGAEQFLTFGGAYSNHIAATAVAAKEIGITAIGVIRGNELEGHPEKWSLTLKQAHANGMRFLFVSRKDYRLKKDAPKVIEWLKQNPHSFVIPEGGSNDLAVKGFDTLCAQINQQLPDWTHLYCPVGTGGTLAGLVANFQTIQNLQTLPAGKNSEQIHKTIVGMAVLNQADYLKKDIHKWIQEFENKKESIKLHAIEWQLNTDACAGGYAKMPNYLKSFQKRFEHTFSIPLDPVYTAKLFYGVYQQIVQKKLPAGSKLLVVHTGGLQGNLIIN